ncbi:hypothetical protein SS1G_02813 [Sclerotinia sclerotiorum 1980 UF-70]|uniref:Uncharacterized protein n=2 Tax=Sclerotinia sclerotiorum (strain ATCC 18683 / 1980 / Ss-1) TaxID=665079 RepID=A7EBX7_SCLS1|nr:hypothetical protein SS1G_02813 [Sclerotinia sclerotiorum 1980 UF-70]APA08964.1 hypothetical protein sscle_04g037340 [Sclerotinia sclerotiorum 1980 UF-70]EDN99955.1 hypothetical protein SS1G_02813 [Sclerotinia sclerotiorum 1980 UF-70]
MLVKNTNKALPLKVSKLLSIYGYDAVVSKTIFLELGFLTGWNVGEGGAGVVAFSYFDAPFDALQRRVYKD